MMVYLSTSHGSFVSSILLVEVVSAGDPVEVAVRVASLLLHLLHIVVIDVLERGLLQHFLIRLSIRRSDNAFETRGRRRLLTVLVPRSHYFIMQRFNSNFEFKALK